MSHRLFCWFLSTVDITRCKSLIMSFKVLSILALVVLVGVLATAAPSEPSAAAAKAEKVRKMADMIPTEEFLAFGVWLKNKNSKAFMEALQQLSVAYRAEVDEVNKGEPTIAVGPILTAGVE
ncbi:uncharacterized protein LOC124312512 [Daphnia pulicaria]|uniref:uncharacterized protein LOC124312512 n=1 Tax=Daphnia pulicaria TaxID=35523 RepID=UPI001EEAD5A5|nr:uncharacterized protein LOC124312512 [Daphnia pulicaria]